MQPRSMSLPISIAVVFFSLITACAFDGIVEGRRVRLQVEDIHVIPKHPEVQPCTLNGESENAIYQDEKGGINCSDVSL